MTNIVLGLHKGFQGCKGGRSSQIKQILVCKFSLGIANPLAVKRWVIMDDFALPVIGEGDDQPNANDMFIDQIAMG